MKVTMLKSKLHRARVTGGNRAYEGSVSLPGNLMDLAGILPLERVEIYNISNGARLATYAIRGAEGEVVMNGAAAHLASEGDRIIVCTYALVDREEAHSHQATVIILDERNEVVRMETRRADGNSG